MGRINNRELVFKLYEEGISYKGISEQTGYCISTIAGMLSRAGKCKRTKMYEEKIDEILELYRQGLNNKEIASQIGCSAGNVGKVLNEHGIYRRITSVNEEVDESNLQFAEPKKMNFEKVVINGKQYTDITDAFL